MGPYLVAIAFWVFVGASAVTSMIVDHKKRRLGIDLLRAAIDKGQPLDPSLVEKIMSADAKSEQTDPIQLKIRGIITVAAGGGVMILAFFISHMAPPALYPVLGGGIVAVCIGTGLIVASNVLAASRERDRLNKTAA